MSAAAACALAQNVPSAANHRDLGRTPDYGYRRIQRLLNRQLIADGGTAVNHKRVYRIMRQNNLLLTRFTDKQPGKAHTGKVSTLRPNQRWCSDGFEGSL